MKFYDKINGNFGFGCMRLPTGENGRVDRERTCEMFDAYLASGLNYFDTAKNYLGGDSEVALHDCLTTRYPRDAYVLTNKLTPSLFEKAEDLPWLMLGSFGKKDFRESQE